MTGFGCERCYGEDAEGVDAFFASGGLEVDQLIVDEPHFIVGLRRCTTCGQAFVSIFTEFVDWSGGEDAQYRDIVPVTPREAATVRGQGKDVDLRYLGSLGEGRRRLSSDWPSDGLARRQWRTGTFWVRQGH